MTFGSLFAGIGGMDLGLERAGMECRWQVEIDPFCRRILAKHWPHVPKYGDIQEVNGYEFERVDLVAGGFPCQDISLEGDRAGIDEGTRSGLWGDYSRIIRVLRPSVVLIENVAALLIPHNDGRPAPVCRVLSDLAEGGLHASWSIVSGCSVGAPHVRERVFIVAYSDPIRLQRWVSERKAERVEASLEATLRWNISPPYVCGGPDGIPDRAHRLKALGNAVAPQVAEWIGRRIMSVEANCPEQSQNNLGRFCLRGDCETERMEATRGGALTPAPDLSQHAERTA